MTVTGNCTGSDVTACIDDVMTLVCDAGEVVAVDDVIVGRPSDDDRNMTNPCAYNPDDNCTRKLPI